jgi:hypothetical protein
MAATHGRHDASKRTWRSKEYEDLSHPFKGDTAFEKIIKCRAKSGLLLPGQARTGLEFAWRTIPTSGRPCAPVSIPASVQVILNAYDGKTCDLGGEPISSTAANRFSQS